MNKKGFTLVELLAVIIVLAILVLLAIPRVIKFMESSRVNAFAVEANQVIKSARNAYGDKLLTEEEVPSPICYTVAELIKLGYLDASDEDISGAVVIDFANSGNADDKEVIYTYLSKPGYYVKKNDPAGKYKIYNSDVVKRDGTSLFKKCVSACVATDGGLSIICDSEDLTGDVNPDEPVITCDLEVGTEWDFAYKGSIDSFEVPCNGKYRLEVWGAAGGSAQWGGGGGKGGYAVGDIEFLKDEKFYVTVGGAGKTDGPGFQGQGTVPGGYNGGSNGSVQGNTNGNNNYGSGGGYTHMSRTDTLYPATESRNIYISVNGGGGGAAYRRWNDQGQNTSSSATGSAGGNNTSFFYSMTDTSSQTGVQSGNGKAKISLVKILGGSGEPAVCENGKAGDSWTFRYTGAEQTWSVPCDGVYEVTVKGGLGGVDSYVFESGGHCLGNSNSGCDQKYIASGKVTAIYNLKAGDTAKYKIGGQGGSGKHGDCGSGFGTGGAGWNGGAAGSNSGGGSGGHTDLYINDTLILEARGGDSNKIGYGCFDQGNHVSGGGSNYINTEYRGFVSTKINNSKADETAAFITFALLTVK